MIIDVLICRPDGTQVLEQQEVSDDYLTFTKETEESSTTE